MAIIKMSPEDFSIDQLTERDVKPPDPRLDVQPESNTTSSALSFEAGFKQANPYASFFSYGADPGNQTDYDFRKDIRGTQWEAFPELFITSDSQEETHAIMNRLTKSMEDRASATKNLTGYLGLVAGGLADPINLIPFIGQSWKYGNIAKSALKGAGGLAAANTAQEVMLYPSQQNKPIEDIYAAAIAGGIMGGFAGGGLGYLGARRLQLATNDISSLLKESFEPNLIAKAAMPEDFTLEGISNSTANVLSPMFFKSSSIKGMTSSNETIRKLTQDVLENNLFIKGNKKGIATPTAMETLLEIDRTKVYQLGKEFDRAYLAATGKDSQMQASIHNLMNKDTKIMSRQEFSREVAIANISGDVHANPHIEAAAKSVRKMFDEANIMLKKAGVKEFQDLENLKAVGADSYLTRIYKKSEVAKRGSEFIDLVTRLLREQNPNMKNASQLATNLRDDILNQPMEQVDLSALVNRMIATDKKPNFAREKINIPDRPLQESGFLIMDADVIASQYYMQASRIYRASQIINKYSPQTKKLNKEGKELISEPNISDLRKLVLQEYKNKETDLINAKAVELQNKINDGLINTEIMQQQLKEFSNKILSDSQKVIEKELPFFEDLMKIMVGTFKQHSPYDEALAWTRTLVNTARMGWVFVTSLSDMGVQIQKHGMGKSLHSFSTVTKDFAKGAKEHVDELKHSAIGIDSEMNSLARALLDEDFYTGVQNKSSKLRQTANTAYFKMNLMEHWTKANERIAATSTKSKIMERLLNYNNLKPKDIEYLSNLGLGTEQIQRVLKQQKYFVENNGGYLVRDELWEDQEIADIFNAAILKDVRSTYLQPTIGDKPLWATRTSLGQSMNQFKSFFEAYTARVLIPSIQRKEANALIGIGVGIFLGSMNYIIRETAKGKEPNMDIDNLILEGLTRSGVAGVIGELSYFTGTNTGLIKRGGSRFYQANLVEYTLGASAGYVQDAYEVFGKSIQDMKKDGDISENTWNAMKKLLPLQNLFYLQTLYTMMDNED
jgi:hypothetical protein